MKTKAFTLVEFIMVSVVLSILTVFLFLILFTSQRSWINSDVNSRVRKDLMRAITTMDSELREASQSEKIRAAMPPSKENI